eukprot:TRINITY_DN66675_c9_g1_i1.p1 TRINITY_DN66675_c9_g1~~TRINITY_DN66675_c9_g1_i1.p1  ORF type:complete len:160 (-),score=22.41 TRINITY_DN66675_c9_g1_i1:300-779(-)
MLSLGVLPLVDIGFSFGIIAVTVWFFFVQSPFLFKRLGRQRFVPIMMQIVQLFMKFVVPLNAVVAILSTLRTNFTFDASTIAACIAVVVTAINGFVIVPKALAAGRMSMKERVGTDDTSSVRDFAVEGGSKTATKALHQTVVLFTLLMVGSLVAHVVLI